VPAVCVVGAGGYLAVFLPSGKTTAAITCAAIMLAYGALLVTFSRRSDIAAILRNDGQDERRHAINMRASVLTLQVITALAVIMLFVNLAQGHDPGSWGDICAVGGLSYIGGIVLFTRRG
jgi:uncharacterized membrane protein